MDRRYRYNWGIHALILTSIVLALGVAGVALGWGPLSTYFRHFPIMNGLIVALFLGGIAVAIRDLLVLQREERALNQISDRFSKPFEKSSARAPMLETVAAADVTERAKRLYGPGGSVRALSAEAAVAGAADEMEARGQILRYIAGILVFLGLLGTFIGLLSTIEGVRDVISNMSVAQGLEQEKDMGAVLTEVRAGIEQPLAGMAIAFSTSLFGLAGSIFVGFLHLIISVAKSKHLAKMEDFFHFHLAPVGGPAVAAAPAAANAGPAMSSSAVESSLLYLKAAHEALGKDLEQLGSMLQRTAGTNSALTGAIQKLEATSDKTNQLLASLAKVQEGHRRSLDAIHAEALKSNEQSLASVEALKQVDGRIGQMISQSETERRASEERMNEHTGRLRREVEILNKTVTSALLELGKRTSLGKDTPPASGRPGDRSGA